MLNRGDSREDDGNPEYNGQRREDETWGHFTRSQYYRGKHNYVVRLCASQSTIFRAGPLTQPGREE